MLVINNMFNKLNLIINKNIDIIFWFLIIILFTIFLKLDYLNTIYQGGISDLVLKYTNDDSIYYYIKIVFLTFSKSIVEITLFLLFLFLLTYKILKINKHFRG